MAPAGRGGTIGGGARGAARQRLWIPSAARAVFLSRAVARRRDALHVDHLAHLLPVHVLSDEPLRSCTTLLDQHGRGRDLDACRHAARGGRATLAAYPGPSS